MKPSFSDRLTAILPYAALVVSILALSLSAMFVRWANAPGPVTGFYRLLFSALMLTPFIIRQHRQNPPAHNNRPSLFFPALAALATALDFAFWNTSLAYTTAANATLIGNSAPLWVALAGLLFFGERLKRDFWAGLGLAMTGAILIMGSDFLVHPRIGLGDLMALAASFFYAIYYLATERGRRSFSALTYAWMMSILAAIFLFFINLLLGNPLLGYPAQSWVIFIIAAFVSQILGYMFITYALGHLPASVVAPTMIGQPLMTTLLAIPLLGEIPSLLQIIGGIIALTGIFIVNQAHNRVTKNPPELQI